MCQGVQKEERGHCRTDVSINGKQEELGSVTLELSCPFLGTNLFRRSGDSTQMVGEDRGSHSLAAVDLGNATTCPMSLRVEMNPRGILEGH